MPGKHTISTHLPPFDPVTLGIQWAVFSAYARSGIPRGEQRRARWVALSAYLQGFPSMGAALVQATELGLLDRASITPLGLAFVHEFQQRQSVPARKTLSATVVGV